MPTSSVARAQFGWYLRNALQGQAKFPLMLEVGDL